jgi:hypothetical protein
VIVLVILVAHITHCLRAASYLERHGIGVGVLEAQGLRDLVLEWAWLCSALLLSLQRRPYTRTLEAQLRGVEFDRHNGEGVGGGW